jgi:phosphotransferase system IIB component
VSGFAAAASEWLAEAAAGCHSANAAFDVVINPQIVIINNDLRSLIANREPLFRLVL